MKASMFIAPRQSGKTTMIMNLVNQEERNVLVISDSEYASRYLRRRYNRLGFHGDNVSFISSSNVDRKVIGCKFDVIYCDEWLFFKPQDQRLIVMVASSMNAELKMYSTPKFSYEKSELEVVRTLLKHNNDAYGFISKLGKGEKYEALKTSLICHPKVEITHFTAKLPKERYEYLIKAFNYNKEAVDREFCAIYEIE